MVLEKSDLQEQLDSLKNKIDELSGKFSQNDKRISDVQKYPTFIVAALTVIILAIGFYNVISWKEEKESLEKAKKELQESINEKLGMTKRRAELVLMADADRPLEGATLSEKVFKREKNQVTILVHFVVINKGSALATPIFCKTYQNPPMNTGSNSSDEREFKFEIGPLQLADVIPPQASATFKWPLSFVPFPLPKAKIPMLIKLYYGNDQLVSAKCFINISE
jgi:hypothetical protein